MDNTTQLINERLSVNQKFDDDVRSIMARALKVNLDMQEAPGDPGYNAVGLMALEVCVSLANIVAAIRRPHEGRTFRALYDMSVGLNANLFWVKHATAIMPIMHMMFMDHLDSLSLQMERGDSKISPYDKLIMGAEATPLSLFSMICFLLGGSSLQMESSTALKKELMPLLMK